MSLNKLLKDHQTQQSQLKETSEKNRKAALQSVSKVTGSLLGSVNEGVSQVFENQKKLENETRALQNQSVRFSKQTTQWISLIENFNKSLKELGDVENWSMVIEQDMKEINSALQVITQERIN